MSGKRSSLLGAVAVLVITTILGKAHGQGDDLAGITLAWVNGSRELKVSVNGQEPVLVATGVSEAVLSPDQRHIAYLLPPVEGSPSTLTITDLEAQKAVVTISTQNLMDDKIVDYERLHFSLPLWVNDSAVLFYITDLPIGPVYDEKLYDLRRLDLNGELTQLATSAESSRLSISPNLQLLAIARAGVYADATQPGTIQLLNPETAEPLSEPFEYPSVAAGSEIPWLPRLVWSADSSTLAFAIPDPDLLYWQEHLPPTRICYWHIPATIDCIPVQMTFPVMPIWNEDLSQIAYIMQPELEDYSQLQLRFGSLVPHGETGLVQRTVQYFSQPVLWLSSENFLFETHSANVLELYIVSTATGEISPWQPLHEDGDYYYLQRLEDSKIALAVGYPQETKIGLYDLAEATFSELATEASWGVTFTAR